MPRLRQVSRSEASADIVVAMYDHLFGPDRDPVAEPGAGNGTPGDWWTVLALVPDVLEHAVRGFRLYRSPRRVLPAGLRELGQTRAGWARGSRFVFSQHCKSCRALGMSEEKIAAIPSWSTSAEFDETERVVLAYTDDLVLGGGRVPDATFEALRRHLSDEQILELTYITAMYDMHAVISRALRTEYDDCEEPVAEVGGADTGPGSDRGATAGPAGERT
jgi:alkylhydroperoxidase family enzyme